MEQMKKVKFVIRKVQNATIEIDSNTDETIGEITDKINVKELKFDSPSYHLIAVSQCRNKIERLLWRSTSC